MTNCGGCFAGLFAPASPPPATAPVLLGSELADAVRAVMREEVKQVRDLITQDLRRFELDVAGGIKSAPPSARRSSTGNVEQLQAQLLKTEHLRRRRSLEAGALRKVLDEVRSAFMPGDEEDDNTNAGSKATSRASSRESRKSITSVQPQDVLDEVNAERQRWLEEKKELEAQIQLLEEELEHDIPEIVPVYDPEKEQLKKSLKQLIMSIESRDRYGCWVCNMQEKEDDDDQSSSGEESSSDDDEDEEGSQSKRSSSKRSSERDSDDDELDEKALLKLQIAECGTELKKLQAANGDITASSGLPIRRPSQKSTRPRVQASPKAEIIEVSAPEEARRSSRGRISTPFVTKTSLLHHVVNSQDGPTTTPEEESSVVKVASRADIEVQEADPSSPMKRSRDRIATPYADDEAAESMDAATLERSFSAPVTPSSGVPRPTMMSAASANAGVRFSGAVSVEEREAENSSQPLRRSNNRKATGFVRNDELGKQLNAIGDASDEKTVQFSAAVSVEEREAENSGKPMRRCRDRQATGFMSEEQVMEHVQSAPPPSSTSSSGGNKKVLISGAVSVEERQVESSGQPMRSCRDRQATGFLTDENVNEHAKATSVTVSESVADSKTVQISNAVSVEEREVDASGAPMRRCRDRQATGFLSEAAVMDHVGKASPAPVFAGTDAAADQKTVQISSVVSVEDREVEGGKPMRRSRERQPTGFLTQQAVQEHVAGAPSAATVADSSAGKRAVQISNDVSVEDREVESRLPMRRCRDRQSTGFLTKDAVQEHVATNPALAAPESGTKAVQISEAVSVEDRDVDNAGQPMRRCRDRQATGFLSAAAVKDHVQGGSGVPDAIDMADGQKSVQISENVVVEDREVASGKPMRRCRERQSTGFVSESNIRPHFEEVLPQAATLEADASTKSVQISDAIDVEEREVEGTGQPLRRCRDRQATGFIGAKDLDEHVQASGGTRGVQISNDVSVEEQPVAPGTQMRRSHDRQVTGFLTEAAVMEHLQNAPAVSADKKTVQISNAVSVEDRAVEGGKQLRQCRDRQATGFVAGDAMAGRVQFPDASADTQVQFSESVTVEEQQASSPSRPMRSCRDRQATGYVSNESFPPERSGVAFAGPDAEPQGSSGVRFADGPDVGQAASTAARGPGRPVRERVATGFVRSGISEDEKESAGVRFADATDEGDAASSPVHGDARPVRHRVATGFVRKEDAPAAAQETAGVRFAEAADVGTAASSTSHGQARPVRERVATGFVRAEDSPEEGRRPRFTGEEPAGVRFAETPEVEAAASSATSGQARPVRGRVATGFVGNAGSLEEKEPAGVRFAEEPDVEAAASSPVHGQARPVRGRVATGYVGNVDLIEEKEPAGVRFADAPEVEAAASSATSGQARPVRGRVATGFVGNAGSLEEKEPAGVRFADTPDVEAAASSATSGQARPVRGRVATGFVGNAGSLEEKEPAGVRFADAPEVEAAASSATSGQARPVRGRVATGFVGNAGTLEEKEPAGVRFADAPDEGTAASSAARGQTRPVRDRVATGFVRAEDPQEDKESAGVRFADAPDEGAAASSAARGQARPVRNRQATGFVRAEDAQEEKAPAGVRFAEAPEEGVASSAAARGQARPVRDRVATGFVRAEDPPEDKEPGGVRFADAPEEGVAASSASRGQARPVRERVATGFVRTEDSQEAKAQMPAGVRFADVPEEGAAASSGARGQARPVRDRVATGFVRAEDSQDAKEPAGVRFAEDPDVEAAASSPAHGQVRPVRGRVATGYVFNEDAQEPSSVRFAEAPDVEASASSATGQSRPVRGRVATGFVHKDALDAEPSKRRVATGFAREDATESNASEATAPKKGGGLRFADTADEVDAASEQTGITSKSVRDRVATPHMPQQEFFDDAEGKGKGIRFIDTAIEVEAASEEAGDAGKSVRSRVSTPHMPKQNVFDDIEGKGVRFSGTAVEEVDAASAAAPGAAKSVRTRVATPHVPESSVFDEAEGKGKGIRFSETAVEVEAASGTADGVSKSLRDRVATPHMPQEDVFRGSVGVRFAAEPAAEEAYSPQELADLKSVQDRVATPHAGGKDVFGDSERSAFFDRGVRFAADKEVMDAASMSAADDPRSLRDRVQTGYVQKEALEGLGVRCAETAEVVEVESQRRESGDPTCKASDAASTASGSERSLRFNDDTEGAKSSDEDDSSEDEENEEDIPARSSLTMLTKRRSRMSTPFMSRVSLGALAEFGTPPTEEALMKTPSRGDGNPKHRVSLRITDSQAIGHIKEASLESHVEHEIASVVQRNLNRKRQHDLCKMPASIARTASGQRERRPSDGLKHTRGDAPEDDLQSHLVADETKDLELLQKTLRGLDFFEDLTDETLESLTSVAEVYAFADGDNVVRQGDTDGTHFFVIAEGSFVVIRDGRPVAEMGRGDAFGESVLLLFGERSATVKARGPGKCYAMEGMAIREALQAHYRPTYGCVARMIDNVIDSGKVWWMKVLKPHQVQCIYTQASLRTFEGGDVFFQKGQTDIDAVYIVVTGTVELFVDGKTKALREKFGMLGDAGIAFQETAMSATASGQVEALVLPKELLLEMFSDQATVIKMLIQDRIVSVLQENRLFASCSEEQRETIAEKCQIVDLAPGDKLDTTDLRFCILLHGAVNFDGRVLHSMTRDESCGFGEEHLLNKNKPWPQVCSVDQTCKLGVWRTKDLGDLAGSHDQLQSSLDLEDKVRVLRDIFLFRTLSNKQCKKLAAAMNIEHKNVGDPVFLQGDMGSEFYIIRSGLVQVTIGDKVIRNMGKGDYFGERALLSQDPRSATIKAVEQSELWKMGQEAFLGIMKGKILEYMKNRIALQETNIKMEDLLFMRVIGQGGFGVVKMVCAKKTRTRYALKCLSKKHAVENGQQLALQNERSILAEIDHPFIIKYVRSFRNETQVMLLTELIGGGELLDALEKLPVLERTQAQFYVGSLILALEFLHARHIAYLDLKSENCLVDHQGYIKMIDFGIAKRITGGKCHTVVGTPVFMAPEMILNRGYTTAADIWSLGVNFYEFMIGEFPFGKNINNHAEVFKSVLKSPVRFPSWFKQKPENEDAMSLMKGMMTRDPPRRVGAQGYDSIKNHGFFSDFNWDDLLLRQITPPFVPQEETYAEGQQEIADYDDLVPLIQEEASSKVADDGWRDPCPGWDDDFA